MRGLIGLKPCRVLLLPHVPRATVGVKIAKQPTGCVLCNGPALLILSDGDVGVGTGCRHDERVRLRRELHHELGGVQHKMARALGVVPTKGRDATKAPGGVLHINVRQRPYTSPQIEGRHCEDTVAVWHGQIVMHGEKPNHVGLVESMEPGRKTCESTCSRVKADLGARRRAPYYALLSQPATLCTPPLLSKALRA